MRYVQSICTSWGPGDSSYGGLRAAVALGLQVSASVAVAVAVGFTWLLAVAAVAPRWCWHCCPEGCPWHGSSPRGTAASHCGHHCLWSAFPLDTQRLLLKVVCTTVCTSLLTAEVLAPELGECGWEFIKPLRPANRWKEADKLQHTHGGAVPSR